MSFLRLVRHLPDAFPFSQLRAGPREVLASLIHCTPLRHMLGQYRDWQALGRGPGGVGNWGASELKRLSQSTY